MSTVNGSDLLAVERSGTLYKIRQDELSTLNNTDLLAVERGGTLYKIAASDLELVTGTITQPVTVVTPVNGSGTNHGQNYNPLSSAITAVDGGGTVTTVETSEITGLTHEPDWRDSITQGYGPWNYRVFDADNATDVINGGASHGARQSDRCGDNSINACHIMSFDFRLVQTNGLSVTSALEVYTFENSSQGPNYDTLHYRVNGGSWIQASLGGNGWLTVATSGTVNTLDLRHKESQYTSNRPAVYGFRLNGSIIHGLGRPTLTLADNTNISNLAVNDTVRQEPSYTPQTAAITSVTAGSSGWDDVSSSLSFPINITSIGWDSGGGGDGCSLTAIEIDGTVLDNTGNRSGNTSYSGTYYGGTTSNIFDGNYQGASTHTGLGGRPNNFFINFGSGVIPTAQSKVRLLWGTESGNWKINGTTVKTGYGFNSYATPNQTLTFQANTDLADLAVNDTVTKVGDTSKTGTIETLVPLSSTMVTLNSNFATGDQLNGPAFQQTDTIRAISGNTIQLNNSAGRWFANENLALGKRESYNTKLTFTDNTELANMMGTASMSDSSGNPITSYSTSNISAVSSAQPDYSGEQTGNGLVTVEYSNNNSSWSPLSFYASNPLSDFFDGRVGSYAQVGYTLNTAFYVRMTFSTPQGKSGTYPVKIRSGSRFTYNQNTYVEINGVSANLDDTNYYHESTLNVTGTFTQIKWYFFRAGAGTTANFSGIEVDGEPLIDRGKTLTFPDSTNFDKFALDEIVQEDTTNYHIENFSFQGYAGGFKSGTHYNMFDDNPNTTSDIGYPGQAPHMLFNAGSFYQPGDTVKCTFHNHSTVQFSVEYTDGTNSGNLYSTGTSSGNNRTISYTIPAGKDVSRIRVQDTNMNNLLQVVQWWKNNIPLIHTQQGAPFRIAVRKLDTTNNKIYLDGGTWSTGTALSKTITTPSISNVVKVDGTELYGSGLTGTFETGYYLKGATSSIQAPTASSVVFTSANDNTAAYNGTLSQLLKRVWSLETSNSASGPWSAATTYDDTSVFATQTGATAWAGRPTLLANTFYRVKVTYQATNAVDVTSAANIFRTGAA